jgi:hypothetical protein
MEKPFGATVLPWMRLLPPWRRAAVRLDSDGRAVLLFETGRPPVERDRKRFGALSKAMERPEAVRGLLADRIPLAGKRDLRFRVRGRELRADAASFFQGNAAVTERLVDTVEACLGEPRGRLLDLYAGVGLFAVCLGGAFARVVASEASSRSARDLKRNLRRAGVRAETRAEPAEVTLRTVPQEGPETVVLDPPRTGLSPEARRALIARAPERIVSVSCDPATGARDAGAIVAAGWSLESLVALDMFPVTAHVETVALLTRSGPPFQSPEPAESGSTEPGEPT